MRLDPFYPIVDSAALVARLVPLGVRLVQLRIKGAERDVDDWANVLFDRQSWPRGVSSTTRPHSSGASTG